MNIIIVGAGKVGKTLCVELSASHHNITVIDKDDYLIDSLLNKVDVNGLVGNGANIDVLKEANVAEADIFIATTDSDEINIIACTLAKKMGATETVSRVRNPEYSGQAELMRATLGISLMINPELSAARAIARSIRFTESSSVQTLAGNRVSLVEIEVTEQSVLANMQLVDFRQKFGSVLVCIIEREQAVFIPSGTDIIQPNDKIFISGFPKDMAHFTRYIRKTAHFVKNVFIVGGGTIAHYLIPLLEHHHMNVKVVETDRQRCDALSEALPHARIIHGDGTDPEVLEEQGLSHFDAFISLTNIDEENLMMALYAAKQGVKKVIAKLSRVNLLKVVDTSAIRQIVTPRSIAAHEIARFVRSRENAQGSNVEGLYRIADDKVEVLVFKVAPTCQLTGIPLMQLPLKKNLLVAYILRKGKIIFPNGQDTLEKDDRVIVVTTQKHFSAIEDILEDE